MTQTYHPEPRTPSDGRGDVRWVIGVALIGLGLLAWGRDVFTTSILRWPFAPIWLLNRGSFELLYIPLLGAILFAWGALSRRSGLLIAGGIVGSIGGGIFLIEGPLGHLSGQARGGAFLLSFALGWFCMALAGALFIDRRHWWPLVPGTVIGAVGVLLMVGRPLANVLLLLAGLLWPLALVIAGLALIVVHVRRSAER